MEMEALNQAIFLGALLVLLSIFAGMLSSRFGAPLLFVFLALGMLAGEDGPGGIEFHDFQSTYLVGSAALAIILFDGGLRTKRADFDLAKWPALALSTGGVGVTAGIVGLIAWLLFGFQPIEALLVGAITASTDAAAVFFLLNVSGMQIQSRVRATLEVESGMNDPMAVFLTIACVEALTNHHGLSGLQFAGMFLLQMGGGLVLGVAGGYALLQLFNRIELAAGLYPILAVAAALVLFGGAQQAGASGFLAVYIAGFVLGNRRHRATQLIARFHDGLAWLSQIVMFLMLGLLVTPTRLVPDLAPSLAIAATLMLVARPVAVALCLLPFRFSVREIVFVSWVGLRGAVPIFLATIPVLMPVPRGIQYFSIAFVVVLASLIVQGWTIGPMARLLRLELPPPAEGTTRLDYDVAGDIDRDIAGYRVARGSRALGYLYAELPLPRRTRIISVIRDGTVMNRSALTRLELDDYVMALAPPEHFFTLDGLFGAPLRQRRRARGDTVFGEFSLDAKDSLGTVADFYCFPIKPGERDMSLAAFVVQRLRHRPVVGDRLRLGPIELVVRAVVGREPTTIGIELEPEDRWPALQRVRAWLSRQGRT